jgi:hypothetical protein
MVRRQRCLPRRWRAAASSGLRCTSVVLPHVLHSARYHTWPDGRTVATAAAARLRRLPPAATSLTVVARIVRKASARLSTVEFSAARASPLRQRGQERRPGWSGRITPLAEISPARRGASGVLQGRAVTSSAMAAACGVTGSSGSPGSAAICGSILLSRSAKWFFKPRPRRHSSELLIGRANLSC